MHQWLLQSGCISRVVTSMSTGVLWGMVKDEREISKKKWQELFYYHAENKQRFTNLPTGWNSCIVIPVANFCKTLTTDRIQ